MNGDPNRDPIRGAWHAVARAADVVSAGAPTAITLLDTPLVAYRDGGGSAVVLPAACPHRGTDLRLGSVAGGCIRCPYHGWDFGASGRCTHIPSLGADGPIPAGAHAQPATSSEHDGLLWVSLDPAADPSAIPSFPVAGAIPGMRLITGDPLRWRTTPGRHVENILDVAHFPFVHPATFGCPEAEVVEGHEVAILPGGIDCHVGVTTRNPDTPAGPLYPGLGPIIRLGYHYTVQLPYRTTLEFAFPDGMRRALHEVATPTEDGECEIFWALLVDERLDSPDEDELAFANAVFAEDKPIIESQPGGVRIDRTAEVHVPADRLAVAYRRALREWGVAADARV
jgi:phenylpropionate dioxygenase-like ring-hydroxylating dioxygenase large terminal subunit